ncbi:GATA zinc finger protein [Actinidia rufa]|uniref:GATA zinc finger protein n=1 Tax=Actinidia rufa TaxID=165716 RepID=A0A7J0EW44_9ERIC|nr:GATA zinc finger protein [Actinidia rufa]
MRPRFNSLPYRPNHPQTDGTTTASASQQVIPSSHCQGNPTNLFPNSSQIQSQMGIINPQMATPFNNSNTHMGNGPVAMSNVPFSAPMGAPNQNIMPLLGSSSVITQFSQFHVLQPSNQGQHNNVLSKMNANAPGQSYNTTQQSQGNSPLPPAFGSVPPQQTPKDFRPPVSTNSQKLAEKLTEPEVIDKDAKLRRQQLKEVLAKQAELGCEVAEIPSSYLSDSEKQVHGREVDKKAFPKKEKFQNKFNKRGRNRQKERFTKKQRLTDHDDTSNSPSQDKRFSEKQNLADNGSRANPSLNKKQPTLLQKLLSADIRKDKRHLLQVFRFMVMNSFFKDCPEKPLRFPLVIVKDTASVGEVVEEKTQSSGRGVSDTYNKTSIGESEHRDYRDGGVADDGKYNNDEIAKAVGFVSLKCGKGGEAQHEEEEGEIID